MLTSSLRPLRLIVALVVFCLTALWSQDREPIAYIGHGVMFDPQGRQLPATLSFLRSAQSWYRSNLMNRLSGSQRTQMNRLDSDLRKGLNLDAQSQLILNASVIDRMMDAAVLAPSDGMRGKMALVKMLLKWKLPETLNNVAPSEKSEPFSIRPEVKNRLETVPKKIASGNAVIESVTLNSGAAYRTECTTAGVPLPPDIGTPGWTSRGLIPQAEQFIQPRSSPTGPILGAEVMTFQSFAPVGMCVALPRFDTANTVQLDGVICMGKVSSKVCFFDNDVSGTQFTFQRGDTVPFANFGGGTQLVASVGGKCTDCHAGENPYIIHGTALNSLAGIPLPTFPDNWYEPIVEAGWPQNPGPMHAPPSCVGCHAQGGAGRFPHLSTELPGYCGIIRAALGALPMPLAGMHPNPTPTMPPGSPGSLAGSPEVNSLLNWCGLAPSGDASGRGDPHITTFDKINYDFQSAGEFVYLRDADGLEIQTRQTPVATVTTPVANAHTGLSSCVSVNTALAARAGKHRISYEPVSNQDRSALELRVDGKPVTLGSAGLDLGGGARIVKSAIGSGIEVFFPDRTHLIATPNFWASQNIWYLNVDVVNTPGREGVMGAIPQGSWLPALSNGLSIGPMPASLHQRYDDLNQKFADSWRVTSADSLFDYEPGTSTATFTNTKWPPENPPCTISDSKLPPAKPMDVREAQRLCKPVSDKNMNAQCVFDLTVTGEPGFAKTYLVTQQLKTKTR